MGHVLSRMGIATAMIFPTSRANSRRTAATRAPPPRAASPSHTTCTTRPGSRCVPNRIDCKSMFMSEKDQDDLLTRCLFSSALQVPTCYFKSSCTNIQPNPVAVSGNIAGPPSPPAPSPQPSPLPTPSPSSVYLPAAKCADGETAPCSACFLSVCVCSVCVLSVCP